MLVLTYGLETITITRKFSNKLQTTQQAMERANDRNHSKG